MPAAERAGKKTAAPRLRDRDATERRLVEAAKKILVEQGFAALGVNSVARAAGVDKQLIYRYFGGLEGLLDRVGGELDFWLGRPEADLGEPSSYGAGVGRLLNAYLSELRANAPTKQVLASELVDKSPAVRKLGEARSKAVGRWLASLRGRIGTAPDGVDAPAINALLLAAIHHLALREASAGDFAGLDLTRPENWRRIEAALDRMTALLDAP